MEKGWDGEGGSGGREGGCGCGSGVGADGGGHAGAVCAREVGGPYGRSEGVWKGRNLWLV